MQNYSDNIIICRACWAKYGYDEATILWKPFPEKCALCGMVDAPSHLTTLQGATNLPYGWRKEEWSNKEQDNWDDAGSMGYQESTWRAAIDYMLSNIAQIADGQSYPVDLPRLLPGPDGSIDLHWIESNEHDLLLNLPASPDEKVTFYGDSRGGSTIKGVMNRDERMTWLLLWITC